MSANAYQLLLYRSS